jgi:hypothetical protein
MFDLLVALDKVGKEVFLRILESLHFELLHLVLVLICTPRDLLIKELKQHDVEAPDVVSPRELLLVVRIQTCIGDGTAEVRVPPRLHSPPCHRVEMLLGQAKVNQVNFVFLVGAESHHEIRWLDISVNQTCIVHALNGIDYLQEDVYGDEVSKILPQLLLVLSQTRTLQIHHYEVLFVHILEGLKIVDSHDVR